MLTDWSCFALIVFEGATTNDTELACFCDHDDQVTPGYWRLPGGFRNHGDANPMMTLERTILKQTGIDLKRKNQVLRFEHTELKTRGTRQKSSERYYLVTVSAAEYISRPGFELSARQHLSWMTPYSIIGNEDFWPEHRAIARLYRDRHP